MDKDINTVDTSEEFLSKEEMANFLKCEERTIDRLRKEGLPAFKLSAAKKGKILFLKSEVITWMKENKRA